LCNFLMVKLLQVDKDKLFLKRIQQALQSLSTMVNMMT
jgi:hypothetical protein